MENQNTELLQELYRSNNMGLEAAEMILPKVREDDLRGHIHGQEEKYLSMAAKTRQMLRKEGVDADAGNPMQKAMLWGSVQMNTLTDVRPGHIAEMMINGTTMGIVGVTKKLNQLESADAGAKKLAEEYIESEQKNIEELKKFLS